MPAKKTDWKKEKKLLQAWLENQPDNNFDPGTEILAKGRRQSVGLTAKEDPRGRAEVMAMLQRGQDRRGQPFISQTMAERMKGLFGGGGGPQRRPVPRERD